MQISSPTEQRPRNSGGCLCPCFQKDPVRNTWRITIKWPLVEMPTAPDSGPASGASLLSDLATARECLSEWCAARGINERAPDDENVRILGALLAQSQELLGRNALPKIPKTKVAIPARVALTGRRWTRFAKWFEEEYKPSMIRHCRATSAGSLVPQRESNGRGGRGDRYEARYFLAYEKPQVDIKLQQTFERFNRSNSRDKAGTPGVGNTKSSLAPKRRSRFNYAIVFMALVALIAFMSLLSIIATKGGPQVFVLSTERSSDQTEGFQKY